MTTQTSSEAAGGSWTERGIGPAEGRGRARKVLSALGLHETLTETRAGTPLSVWRCQLRDEADQPVPYGRGLGKGSREEAETGALFEALEHYLTGPDTFDAQQVQWCSGAELLAGPLGDDVCAPLLRAADRVACQPYLPVDGGAAPPLALPVIMSTSWYYDTEDLRQATGDATDYRQLARYGSNSGSAIGSTLTEALLHALNECIERDALSLLLARAWPGAGAYRPRLVDVTTLPPTLAAGHRQAETLRGAPVHLVDVSTDLGVPSYVACTSGPGSFELRFGAGTSLSPHYAAWRALGELVQSSVTPSQPSAIPLDGLAPYPALRACATFDLAPHLDHADLTVWTNREPPHVCPGEQLTQLTARLAARGHRAYYRVTATAPEGITAAHVFVPGLERFMTVTSSVVTIPGIRARTQITAGT